MSVYLDHNATTPPHPEVLERLSSWAHAWGNPSSVHALGREPKRLLREAREQVGQALGADPMAVIFTSGGSESIALGVRGAYQAIRKDQPERVRVVTSTVEHPAVRETVLDLGREGAEIVFIPVDREGRLDLAAAETLIDERTALVSVMAANNETGSCFPIQELSRLAHARGARIHSDGVQTLGKMPVDVTDWGVDYASFSGHKLYALKGSGVLYQRKGAPLCPQILGGGHERRRRAGTENVLAIASLGFMAAHAMWPSEWQRWFALRELLEGLLQQEVPDIVFTGRGVPRAPNTTNFFVNGVAGEALLMGLDLKGFCVSSGSACSSGSSEPSPVLLAMGLSHREADSSLRVSLGMSTTESNVRDFVIALKGVVARSRGLDVRGDLNYGA